MTGGVPLPDTGLREQILHSLQRNGELSQKKLCKSIGGNWQRIVNEVRALVELGHVRVRSGKFRANLYDLAPRDVDEELQPAKVRCCQSNESDPWHAAHDASCHTQAATVYRLDEVEKAKADFAAAAARLEAMMGSTWNSSHGLSQEPVQKASSKALVASGGLEAATGQLVCAKLSCGRPANAGGFYCDGCASLSRQQLGLGG